MLRGGGERWRCLAVRGGLRRTVVRLPAAGDGPGAGAGRPTRSRLAPAAGPASPTGGGAPHERLPGRPGGAAADRTADRNRRRDGPPAHPARRGDRRRPVHVGRGGRGGGAPGPGPGGPAAGRGGQGARRAGPPGPEGPVRPRSVPICSHVRDSAPGSPRIGPTWAFTRSRYFRSSTNPSGHLRRMECEERLRTAPNSAAGRAGGRPGWHGSGGGQPWWGAGSRD